MYVYLCGCEVVEVDPVTVQIQREETGLGLIVLSAQRCTLEDVFATDTQVCEQYCSYLTPFHLLNIV
jgi:hypothetical protein